MDSEDFNFDFGSVTDAVPFQPKQKASPILDRDTLSKQLLPVYVDGSDVKNYIIEAVRVALTTDAVLQLFPEINLDITQRRTFSLIDYNSVYNLAPIRDVCADYGFLYEVLSEYETTDYTIDQQWHIYLKLINYNIVQIVSKTLTETEIRNVLKEKNIEVVSIEHFNDLFSVRFPSEEVAMAANSALCSSLNLNPDVDVYYAHTFKFESEPINTNTEKIFDKDRRNKKRNGNNRGGRGRGNRGRKKKGYGYNNRYMKQKETPKPKPEPAKETVKNVDISGEDFPPLADSVSGYEKNFNRYTNSTISSTILENKENVEWENESEAIADERHTTLEMENEPSNNGDWHVRKSKNKSHAKESKRFTTYAAAVKQPKDSDNEATKKVDSTEQATNEASKVDEAKEKGEEVNAETQVEA